MNVIYERSEESGKDPSLMLRMTGDKCTGNLLMTLVIKGEDV